MHLGAWKPSSEDKSILLNGQSGLLCQVSPTTAAVSLTAAQLGTGTRSFTVQHRTVHNGLAWSFLSAASKLGMHLFAPCCYSALAGKHNSWTQFQAHCCHISAPIPWLALAQLAQCGQHTPWPIQAPFQDQAIELIVLCLQPVAGSVKFKSAVLTHAYLLDVHDSCAHGGAHRLLLVGEQCRAQYPVLSRTLISELDNKLFVISHNR